MSSKARNLLSSGVTNVAQSFYDNFVQSNAELRASAGVRAVIIRRVNRPCCDWCKSLEGRYDIDDAPDNIYRRHKDCDCTVVCYDEKGYTDAWSKKVYQTEQEARKAKVNEILAKNDNKVEYQGIPRNWTTISNPSDDDALVNANPFYEFSKKNSPYNNNCVNCVCAYEMRKRKIDVIAQPRMSNHFLERNPWKAWKDLSQSDIIQAEGNGLKDIIKTVSEADLNARYEVLITFERGDGHAIVAEKSKNGVVFLDPQAGRIFNTRLFEQVKENETMFWRIDDKEFSDRGITACQMRKK